MALSRDAAAKAIARALRRPENLDFFFDRLNSPEWIEPLREERLFASPPEQYVDEEGLVHAPPWAPSRYLARVAALAPAEVLDVAMGIETNNERVYEDLADAAIAMPSDYAERMADLLIAFVESRSHIYYLLPRKLVDLIIRLADGGKAETSARLITALFAAEPTADDGTYWRPRTKSRFSDWEYDMHLRKIVEEGIPLAPRLFLQILVDLLEGALALLRSDADHVDGDGSRAWRVRIADDRDRGDDPEHGLTSAARDAARLIREHKLMTDRELVAVLTTHPAELFRRIAMDALAHGDEPQAEVVREFVLDGGALLYHEPSPEFRTLVTRVAATLEPSDVDALVQVILAGPDVDAYRRRVSKFHGAAPSEEAVAEYVAGWQIGRLALLESVLPADARAFYDSLVERYGPVDLPLSWEVTTVFGDKSPATVDDLRAKSNSELVAYLEEWEPSSASRFDGPSIEGLARTIAALAEQEPERVSSLAPQLRRVRPAYLQWMMIGLEQAITANRALDWDALVPLMVWIVDQPREIPGGRGDDYADLDPGWVWTRGAILGLIERALRAPEPSRPSFDKRQAVWLVIEALASDPEPTPEYEKQYGQDNMDPVTLSLNTVRPRAVRVAIAYAVWVYQKLYGTDAPSRGGFFAEEAPEVAALLESRLDPAAEQSVAVRAVLGEFYANLFALDPAWAGAAAGRIFPDEESKLRAAAWGAYIIYTRPYDNVFEALRDVYVRSAAIGAGSDYRFRWMNSTPVESLGDHIAAFIWRGLLDVSDVLVATYWREAPPEGRAHVIEVLGRWAREAEPATETVDRLQRLWEWAKDSAASRGALDELAGFSSWMQAAQLPLDWRLDELWKLLERGVRPHHGRLIAEVLPSIATSRPRRAVQVLLGLIEVEDRWFVGSQEEEIERVLQVAYASDDPEARRLAYDAVNTLLNRGYRNFAYVVDGQAPTTR